MVTDEITFDPERNVPPVIYDVQGSNTRIGDIIYFNVESPGTITFEFRVRDENIDQPLEYRRKILEPGAGTFVSYEETRNRIIPPSYEPIRVYEDDISSESFLRDSCYRIEVAVSYDFKYASDVLYGWDVPEEKEDVAKAIWYVVTGEETKCPRMTKYE